MSKVRVRISQRCRTSKMRVQFPLAVIQKALRPLQLMLMSRLSRCHQFISHLHSVWTKMVSVIGAHFVKRLVYDHSRNQALQLRLGKGLARPSTRPKTSSWKSELIPLRIRSVLEGWVWRSVQSWKTASNRSTTTSTLIRTYMGSLRGRRSSNNLKKKNSKRLSSWDFANSCTHGTANQSNKEKST